MQQRSGWNLPIVWIFVFCVDSTVIGAIFLTAISCHMSSHVKMNVKITKNFEKNGSTMDIIVKNMANATALDRFLQLYNFLVRDLADLRTRNWFLVDEITIVPFTIFYIFFSTKLGPELMRNRKPLKLTNVLIVYNFLQVLLSIYLFYEALDAAYLNKYSLKCEPFDPSTSPDTMKIVRLVHTFYMANLSELLDTFFFVLRKKNNQITFLHVYHHAAMLITAWFGVKYFPTGHSIFVGFVNTFVHIIMYSYYMLSAMGPELKKYLWWKKYLTVLQMVQFGLVMLHQSQLLLYNCNYPKWMSFIVIPHAILFYVLFKQFYNENYKNQKLKLT